MLIYLIVLIAMFEWVYKIMIVLIKIKKALQNKNENDEISNNNDNHEIVMIGTVQLVSQNLKRKTMIYNCELSGI